MKNTRSELCLITKTAAMLMQQMPPKYCIKIVISNELHKYWNVFFMWKCNNFKGFQTPFKWRLKAFLYRACAIIFSHFVLYPDYRISFFIPLAFRFADYMFVTPLARFVLPSGFFFTYVLLVYTVNISESCGLTSRGFKLFWVLFFIFAAGSRSKTFN